MELARVNTHRGTLLTCAFSPDGRQIASGGAWAGNVLKVWDAESGDEIATLTGHGDAVTACKYSPNGQVIISASRDTSLIVWDAETFEWLSAPLEGHTDRLWSCGFSPDGRRVVSVGQTQLKVWDIETGLEIASMQGRMVRAWSYSPDGRRIVAAFGTTLQVWDAETGAAVTTLVAHAATVLACAYSRDGRRIVSKSQDGTLRIWDTKTGVTITTFLAPGLDDAICAYSPDGRRVVAGSGTTVNVWDVETTNEIATFFTPQTISALVQGAGGKSISAGDTAGGVCILRLLGTEFSPPILTPIHLYRFKSREWDAGPTALCESCGRRFVTPRTALDAILDIARNANLSLDDSPCAELPAEAWDDPRLFSECPHCRQPVRFNPFIVDNRDRY